MEKYKKMYALLCAAASEALDVLPDAPENDAGRALLQKALYEAEEIYVSQADDRKDG